MNAYLCAFFIGCTVTRNLFLGSYGRIPASSTPPDPAHSLSAAAGPINAALFGGFTLGGGGSIGTIHMVKDERSPSASDQLSRSCTATPAQPESTPPTHTLSRIWLCGESYGGGGKGKTDLKTRGRSPPQGPT